VVQFRKEVIEAQRRAGLGTIVIATPHARWLITSLAVVLAAGVIGFGTLASYTRRVPVVGHLIPSQGLVSVSSEGSGTITAIRVHEGDTVRRGDVIAEITHPAVSLVGDSAALVQQQLDKQQRTIEASLQDIDRQTQLQTRALRAKVDTTKSQIAQVQQQIAMQDKVAAESLGLLKRMQEGEKVGYISELSMHQQHAQAVSAQSQADQLRREALQLQADLENTREQLGQIPVDADAHRNDLQRQLADITKSRIDADQQHANKIVAPLDGMVASVVLHAGQEVHASQTVASIVPAGSELMASFVVPSSAIPFAVPGTQLSLRYRGFPYQKYGQFVGHISDVSRAALTPSQVDLLDGDTQTGGESFYQVRVALDRQSVIARGVNVALEPGMTLDADVFMERRTLLQWVFEPLLGAKHRLIGATAHG
jgi:membrane fusion protein